MSGNASAQPSSGHGPREQSSRLDLTSPFGGTIRKYLVFVIVLLGVFEVISLTKNLLLAPPYAVSIYLTVFDHHSRFARPESIATSYAVVIASSSVFQYWLGATVLTLLLNVLLVSSFISFTPYTHPPALALTLFSYLVHDLMSFTIASIVVLAIVVVVDLILDRTDLLNDRPGPDDSATSPRLSPEVSRVGARDYPPGSLESGRSTMSANENPDVKVGTSTNFESLVLGSKTPVVVDFWAPWCIWCKKLAPIYNELASTMKGELTFVKVNVDVEQALASRYDVSSLPTLKFFCEGREIGEFIGALPREQLQAKLREVVGMHIACINSSSPRRPAPTVSVPT